MFPMTQIPMGSKTGRESVKELAKIGFDTAVTGGIGKIAGKVPSFVKGASELPGKAVGAITRPFTKLGSEITPIARQAMMDTQLGPHGIDANEIARLTKEYGGSTGKISQRIREGLLSKQEEAKGMYKSIEDSMAPDSVYNPESFVKSVDEALSKLEPVLGKEHPLVGSLSKMKNDLMLPPEVDQASGLPVMQLEPSPSVQVGKNKFRPIKRDELFNTRDRINQLFSSDPNVGRVLRGVKHGIYAPAEEAGIEGIPQAREAYKKAFFDYGDRYLDKYNQLKLPENSLEQIGTGSLDEQKVQALQELESYLGKPFMDESSKINMLRDFESKNPASKVQTSLEHAGKLGNVQARKELSAEIGPKAPQIFKDIRKNNAVKGLLKTAGTIGLFGSGWNVFNSLSGKHIPHGE